MNVTYELWDADAGNVVGEFASAAEAIDVVQALLNAFGSAYADVLVLQRREGSGRTGAGMSGNELIQLVAGQVDLHAGMPTGT